MGRAKQGVVGRERDSKITRESGRKIPEVEGKFIQLDHLKGGVARRSFQSGQRLHPRSTDTRKRRGSGRNSPAGGWIRV